DLVQLDKLLIAFFERLFVLIQLEAQREFAHTQRAVKLRADNDDDAGEPEEIEVVDEESLFIGRHTAPQKTGGEVKNQDQSGRQYAEVNRPAHDERDGE